MRRAHAPSGPLHPHDPCRAGLAPVMAREAAAPGFGGAASRAEWLFGASQVAAAFLQGIQGPQEGLQRPVAGRVGPI